MAFLYTLLIPAACRCQEHRCSIGIDIAAFTRTCTSIDIGYGFGEHWSVSGGCSFNFSEWADWKSDLQKSHENELGSATESIKEEDLNMAQAMFVYWPEKFLNGSCVGLGLQKGNRTGMDYIIEIGYAFKIWKHLNANASYRIPVKGTIKDGKFTARGIKLNISYVF